MKKLYLLLFLALPSLLFASGGPNINSAVVPQYIQGNSSTNNNRVPFWFWVTLGGLTPGATYHFYTSMDSLNASATSNGAGNPYLVNMISGNFRRTTNPSMTSNTGFDSLTANVSGTFSGWFGVEPTGNGRFTPGNILYAKIMLNNGAGGTTVASRLLIGGNPVTVINFGTSVSATEGSALYDSVPNFMAPPKSFAFLFDNQSATGRPLSIAVLEDDGIDLNSVTQVAAFYRNLVDSMPQHWGTIIPNMNAQGVRRVEYRDFANSAVLNFNDDNNGIWCSNANTVNPVNGNAALFLDANFSLSAVMTIDHTAVVGFSPVLSVSSNGSGVQYTWDFGDSSPTDTAQNPTHIYTTPGTYTVTVTVQAPECGLSLTDSIVVILFTDVNSPEQTTVSLTPNPSEGLVTLRSNSAGPKQVAVMDVMGKIVYTTTVSGMTSELDLGALPKGVYFVETRTGAAEAPSVQRIILR